MPGMGRKAKKDIERIVRAWCDWRDSEPARTKR
jgi:hypothetical protein